MEDKKELYRRLEQAWRMVAEPIDPLTKGRLTMLVAEIESQLAKAEAAETDGPPE